MRIKENEILANHSTFRIGGPARYFVVAKSKEELIEAIEFANSKGLPFFVFGGGSNTLFRDEGFDGVAIKSQISNLKSKNCNIVVGSGVLFSKLIMESINAELAGLEWGMGIPGTIGGAVAVNCAAYGHSISEFVQSVTVLNQNMEIKKYLNNKCEFCYHESKFKKHTNKEIILEVDLRLKKSDKEMSKEAIRKNLLERNKKLPKGFSIGSIFKNLILKDLENREEFLKRISHHKEKIRAGKFPVDPLIEDCGLKGKRIGDAVIAKEHANFIVNAGGAKANDVLELIKLCKQKVREKFNINLEEEIVVLPRQAEVI